MGNILSKPAYEQDIFINYDEGIVYRKVDKYGHKINDWREIGYINNHGYKQFRLNGKIKLLHRFIYEKYIGRDLKPNEYTDHINRNRLDNRLINLRIVSRQQNNQNRTKNKNNISGYIGVCFHKRDNKWQVRIRHPESKKRIHLGLFENKKDAGIAYLNKAIEYNEKYNSKFDIEYIKSFLN